MQSLAIKIVSKRRKILGSEQLKAFPSFAFIPGNDQMRYLIRELLQILDNFELKEAMTYWGLIGGLSLGS